MLSAKGFLLCSAFLHVFGSPLTCDHDKCQAKSAEQRHETWQAMLLKIQDIQHTVKLSKESATRQMADGMKTFTALRQAIDRSQAELFASIQKQQRATERQAAGLLRQMEEEAVRLTSEPEMLTHTEDHLLSAPHNGDWTEVRVQQPHYVATMRRALDKVEKTLSTEMRKQSDAELEKVQQHAVDVTLDPATAQPKLVLSEDGKQVYHGNMWTDLPDNAERFSMCPIVLGKQNLSSGRFYFEVEVTGKTNWDLGVAQQSINRKAEIVLCPKNGFWTIWLRNGQMYQVLDDQPYQLSLKNKLQKVGVFVDYEEGLVSFYDVGNRVHIYSFTGCTFTEPLYPYFGPDLNYGGRNSAPLIITPVNALS